MDQNRLDKYLQEQFDKRGLPGMAVCIRGPEGVVYEGSFGCRSVQPRLPVTGDTIFGIASMSKSITALACCILEAEGKMSLEDPVATYFPELHIPGTPDQWLTVETLATHRSGIPPMEPLEWSIAMNSAQRDSDWYRQMRRTASNKMDQIQQIVDYISAGDYTPLGAPGEMMSYSNEGYALLSYIVDQAAGICLERFLQERIFAPLGMDRTVLDVDASQARAISGGDITSLFERDQAGQLVWDDDWSILPPFRGCGCVKSTARDITKYYQMLAQGGVWEGKQVIPAQAVERLAGRGFPVRVKPVYCLGLEKRLLAGKVLCQHSGGLHGVSTIGGFLEGGFAVAALCNEGDVDMTDFLWICLNHILGLPLDTRHPWAVPNGRRFDCPEILCGHYLCREGVPAHCVVYQEDGCLKADYQGRKTLLQWCGKNVFAAMAENDPRERVSTLQFYAREGRPWCVRCGSRVYQMIREQAPE